MIEIAIAFVLVSSDAQWSMTPNINWNGISICYTFEDIQDLKFQMLLISII